MKLTTIILTKNEEKNLSRAIKSAQFSDEVIIVDDFSTDKTTKLAEKLGAKVYKRKLNGDFSAQRNFGFEKGGGDWVLFLDADEEVSKELATEIKKIINSKSEISAYYIKRRDYFWGREMKYGETLRVRANGLIRLVRKGSGKWHYPVHEVFQTSSSIGKTRGFINHYSHGSLKEFLNEVNFYSTLRAKYLYKIKKSPSLFEVLFWPPGKFIYSYILKLGFLDGVRGFIYSFLLSFHSFLVRAKLYQYQKID